MKNYDKAKQRLINEPETSQTQFKHIEKTLRESEERFRALTESTSDWVWEVNVDGVYTYASPKVKDLLGYEPEEVVGKTPFDLMPPEEAKRIAEEFRAIVESQRPFAGLENTNLHRDGRSVVLETSGVPFFNADGRLCGYRGIDRDITARKRMEYDLKERVKELNCLYGIAQIAESPDITLDELYQETTNLLPASWQYPEITCARTTINGKKFETENYRDTGWRQSSDIKVDGVKAGVVEVCYLEERPEIDEGPFPKEERLLIDAVAQRLGRITEHKRMERELVIRSRISNVFASIPDEEMYGEVLHVILEATESKYGVFGYIDDDGDLACPSMTSDIWEQCQIPDKTIVFPRETWGGIWGRALAEGKTLYSNEPFRVPEGHIPIIRALDVPIIHQGEVIGNLLVGNKSTDYDEKDVKLLESITMYIAPILQARLQRDRRDRERKRMEEALRESEEKWRSLVENAPNIIIIAGRDGTIQFINRTPSGIDVKDVIGGSLYDYTQPEYHDVMREAIKRVFDTREPCSYEVRGAGPDGQVSWYETQAGAITLDGRVVAVTLITVDVTEHKQVEEEELRKFKTISDRAGYGATISKPDGNLVYVNEVFARMHGYAEEELIGKHLSIFHTEEQMKLVERLRKQLIKAQSYVDEEVWHKRKDGTVFPTMMNGTAMIDDKGKPLYLCATAVDSTERKQVEYALQQSEQNFRNSLDNSPLGIRIVTSDGELLYANQAILDIYGYSSIEELGAVPAEERYTPESYVEHQKRKESRRLGNPVPSTYEISIVRKDGEVRHLLVSRKEVIWNGEKQFQALYRDVTEQKQAAIALKQSEEFNSGLLTNSPNPILVINVDTSIRYVNPALEKLTGFSSAKVIGSKPPYPWWIEEDYGQRVRSLTTALRRQKRERELVFRKKNGERFWVQATSTLVKVGGEPKFYISNWVDITERKRRGENIKSYISEVTKAQEEERKRIARNIHDESIQSLATLALDIDAIARDKSKLSEDIIQSLAKIRGQTNDIIDGLRRFSHDLQPGVIDQVGLIPALEILAEELNEQGGINASLEIAGSERRLKPDIELALFRIAQEALRNVRRHSGATQAAIRLVFSRRKVRMTISDNGKGFKPPKTLSDFAAVGKLGLLGMQERTHLLDGKLSVKSRHGEGTTIAVEVGVVG